jgi:cyclophilin family peptidyl-prolyl cis-trans isomerase
MMQTFFLVAVLVGTPSSQPHDVRIKFKLVNGESFVIETEARLSPKAVAHIVNLARQRFYDGQRIHRVEPWVIQFGAPQSKAEPLQVRGPDGVMGLNPKVGDGGSGYAVPFEASSKPFVRGAVGLASEGKDLGGDSQIS